MVVVGLPQQFNNIVEAVIQIIIGLAIANNQQTLYWGLPDDCNLSPDKCENMYFILNLAVKTFIILTLQEFQESYNQLDINFSIVVHPKCPAKEFQNVVVNVIDKDGWDKVLGSCPECGTTLREDRKLVTDLFSSSHSTS